MKLSKDSVGLTWVGLALRSRGRDMYVGLRMDERLG